MGMFDQVQYSGDILQTKDFDCEMRRYRIVNGRLEKQVGEYVVVKKEERNNPNAPEGSLEAICGMLKFSELGWEDINFHGILKVGGRLLKFTDGNLVQEIQA